MNTLDHFFGFRTRGTTFRTELTAGITTFMTMAYVLGVQPGAICGYGPEAFVVDVQGVVITKEALAVSCALISGVITLLMACYANLPFALSTGMGSNFLFGTLIQQQILSFGGAMAITLVSGIIFVILTAFGIRDLVVKAIPKSIKAAIGTAIGFFIARLGFTNAGIFVVEDGSVAMGDFTQPTVWLAVLGLVIIAALTAWNVKGALLFGILAITVLGIPLGVTVVPESLAKVPELSGLAAITFNLDWSPLLRVSSLTLVFIAFFCDFFSTLGTVLGVSQKAGMVDEQGNIPRIQRPFMVDAIGTCVGACTGNTTITTFVESTAGVEAGGRTGFTSVVTGVLMLLMTFFSPLVLMIPNAATAPALIFVGVLMLSGIRDIDFAHLTESFGPIVMIMFTAFGGDIGSAISAGILCYLAVKLCTRQHRDIHLVMYLLAIPLIFYFIVS